MSSMDFSIASLPSTSSPEKSSKNGQVSSDSDSEELLLPRSSPAKRNRGHEKSLVVGTTDEEVKYRRSLFPYDDFTSMKKKGLECTSCGCKILIETGVEIKYHLYLQVAQCKDCKKFYGQGDFSADEDGTDKFCRWCGNGGDLFCCSTCTCVFCQKCIKRNLGRTAVKKIEEEESWDCFICDIKPLWKLRGLCWGAQQYIDTLKRSKKQRVAKTLLELSEEKRRPSERRLLVRTTNDSSSDSDSEDTVLKPNSNEETLNSNGSTDFRKKHRPTVKKLFTQEDNSRLLISPVSDDEQEKNKASKKTKALPSSIGRSNGFQLESSDSDSGRDKRKSRSVHKTSSGPMHEENKLTTMPKRKDKEEKEKSLMESDDNEEEEGKQIITSKSTDSRPESAVSFTINIESQAKEFTPEKKKKKGDEPSSESSDGLEKHENKTVVTGSNESSPTSLIDETDNSDSDNRTKQSRNKEKSKKKPEFSESQAKKSNTGKRTKYKKDEVMETDSIQTSQSIANNPKLSVIDATTDSDSDKNTDVAPQTSAGGSKKANLSDARARKGKKNDCQKPTKSEKQKKQEVSPNSDVDEGRVTSPLSGTFGINLDSDNHSSISISSKITERRASSDSPKKSRQDFSLNKNVSVDSATKKGRSSSCVGPYSDSKRSEKKRSASADCSLDTERVEVVESEEVPNEYENSPNDSENSSSSEDMNFKIDKSTSENMLRQMQEQCSVMHALGKSLCRVTKIINSKINDPADFTNAQNIKKIFKRMKRMTKSVTCNTKTVGLTFESNYKNWKRATKSAGKKGDEASTSEVGLSATAVKQVQDNIAAWEKDFRRWVDEDSSDGESSVKKRKGKKKKEKAMQGLPDSSAEDEVVSVSRKEAKASSKGKTNIKDSIDVNDEDINESASLISTSTQPYDYEAQFNMLSNTAVDKSNVAKSVGSEDMFGDIETEEPVEDQTPEPSTGKSKSKKKDGSKLSAELVIERSDDSDGGPQPADEERVESSDSDDFLLATLLSPVARSDSVSPAAAAVQEVPRSDDEPTETPKKRDKKKSTRSPACPKSKKKVNISVESDAGDQLNSSGEITANDAKSNEGQAASIKQGRKTRLSLSKSDKDQKVAKRDVLSSGDDLSPSKAKALLLADSSDDEPLDESDPETTKSGKKSSCNSKSTKPSSKKSGKRRSTKSSKNRSSVSSDADSEEEDDRSKKRSSRKSKPEKALSAKAQAKLDRRLLRSCDDPRLLQELVVMVKRLEPAELLLYGIEDIPKMKKKTHSKSSESDDSSSIARLVNLKTARKRNRAKQESGSGDDSADEPKPKQSKKSKKGEKKGKGGENKDEQTVAQHSGSDDDVEDALAAKTTLTSDNPLTEQELREMNNRELKERLLASTSDDDNDDDAEAKPTEDPKKKKSKKGAKDEDGDDDGDSAKKKKSKKEKSGEKKGSDSEDSNVSPSKRPSRRSKLLNQRLSMSDSSEDEAKFKAKEARLKKEKENAGSTPSNSDSEEDAMLKTRSGNKKATRRNKIKSDSDESVQIAESSSSNSDDDFIIPSRSKRKGKRSDSDSSDHKKKTVKRRRIKTPKDDSDSEDEDPSQNSTPGKGRKNIRKVMTEESVGEQTKRAAREETERKKRIEEKQILYNKLYGTEVKMDKNVVTEKLVLDFDPDTKEELVKVHDSIVRKLKPHQVRGVEFMWNVCYESVKQLEKSKGVGCILAHCMGLGKTFQVVTLVHTLLTNPLTKVKTVLVVCPLSTALNWVNEFRIWLKDTRDEEEVDVYELSRYKKPVERMHKLEEWKRNGGVMVMNYELYRTLSTSNVKRLKQNIKKSWERSLVDPGPDLVVCDEGHLLKNEDSGISKAMRRLKTLRRIVLTGTPLQNNLVEYHCMVNFVRPNLLGTRKEFMNRFVNPITNGQYEDSTAHDVKIMKRRAHVLHKMLDGIVQRYDYSELTPFLPEKQEYVISVRLSEPQTKIYQHFLDHFSGLSLIQNGMRNTRLLPDWHVFQRISTHPKAMLYHEEGAADKEGYNSDESEGSLKDFIDDDDDDDEDTPSEESSDGSNSKEKPAKPVTKRRLRGQPEPEPDPEPEAPAAAGRGEWWREFCPDDVINGINSSGKLALLFAVLRECEKIGDKVLVFSQSLFSLRLIEEFLDRIDKDTRRVQREARAGGDVEPEPDPQLAGHTGTWVKGYDYFRLDGSISAENRNRDCKQFNNKSDHRSRLYLISTKAGGLGINLVAANRVIVFDASWNPSHDVQSIFRVFRFGQVKPCYIYRFLAYSTIEERVYERQVTKLSLSCRVVDEQQIDRHYTNKDIMAMYTFDHVHKTDRPTPILPKDRMLAELLKEHGPWIETYHEHDSLLENKAEEELNEEERKAAWAEYESEKRPQITNDQYVYMLKNNIEALRNLLKSQNPDADDGMIEQSIAQIRVMAEQVEAKQLFLQQQRMIFFQQQQQQQQQQMQQQQQFNALERTNPFYRPQGHSLLQSAMSGGHYQVNPAAAAASVQMAAHQSFMKQQTSGIMKSMANVASWQQQEAAKPTLPRISVRSVADMQMPSMNQQPRRPQILPTGHAAPSGSRFQYPRFSYDGGSSAAAAAAAAATKPREPKKKDAPMSPINID